MQRANDFQVAAVGVPHYSQDAKQGPEFSGLWIARLQRLQAFRGSAPYPLQLVSSSWWSPAWSECIAMGSLRQQRACLAGL